MIRQATEGDITWLPGLVISDIPNPLPGGISIHTRRDEIGLEFQNIVGAIPLLNGDTLQIISKFGRVNFLRLLFKAEGFQGDLVREYDEFVGYSVEDDQNVDSVVARQLMISAATIMNRSPKHGRVHHQRDGLFAVGQLDAAATARNIACHKQEPVAYTVKEKTLDIPENRVITEALLRAWPFVEESDNGQLTWIFNKWLGRFSRSENLGKDLDHVERSFAMARYGGPRDYYRKALVLSQIVLGINGLGFNEALTIEGDAVLLNTADIFERYLRNVIGNAYGEAGYIVTKGGTIVSSLYTDGSFEVKPDIVVSRDGHTLLIADAKYKQPTASDHYQMNAYLAVNGVKRGLLLSPLSDGDHVLIREYSTPAKIVVREAYLPMSNLNATEEFLASLIERFV
jgi:5-methylcytosine-specific restriction enzyme subunit McrC